MTGLVGWRRGWPRSRQGRDAETTKTAATVKKKRAQPRTAPRVPLAALARAPSSLSKEWVGKASVLGFWDFLAAAEKAFGLETGLALHTQAAKCILPVPREVKMEIPVKTFE